MKQFLYLFCIIIFLSCSSLPKNEERPLIYEGRKKALVFLKQGDNSFNQNFLPEAENYYRQALNLSSSIDWDEGILRSLLKLDELSYKENDKQINSNLNRARYFYKNSKDPQLRILLLNYEAQIDLYNNQYSQALDKISISLSLNRGNSAELSQSLRLKAMAYKGEKHYGLSQDELKKAIEIDKKIGDYLLLAEDHYLLGSVLFLDKKYNDAIEALNIALDYDKSLENTKGIKADYRGLAKIYSIMGNSQKEIYLKNKIALMEQGSSFKVLKYGESE